MQMCIPLQEVKSCSMCTSCIEHCFGPHIALQVFITHSYALGTVIETKGIVDWNVASAMHQILA